MLDELHDTGATIFADYFSKANLSNLLADQSRTLTLFAPTNEAFDELEPEGDGAKLAAALLEAKEAGVLPGQRAAARK